jgi:hypothetical protein
MKPPIDWLLSGPAFVRYSTLVDLCGESGSCSAAKRAYADMRVDPRVKTLIAAVNGWERQPAITRHNDAAHPLHKLVFAADLGIKRRDLKPGVDAILAHQSSEGPFQLRIQIPPAFGGDGVPRWDWVATDAPLILYALLRLGVRNREVTRGLDHIRSRIAEPGYPCFASSSMGRFKGPGRRADPCPYANLIILRMLSEVQGLERSAEAKRAVSMLLHHWEVRGDKKYFLFGIGTDFAKPKAPLIWYDILHYTDTLTRFPSARRDPRLREVMDLLASRADAEGRLTSASIWTRWKGWEFCQKKEPSFWLTFLFHRARHRMRKVR